MSDSLPKATCDVRSRSAFGSAGPLAALLAGVVLAPEALAAQEVAVPAATMSAALPVEIVVASSQPTSVAYSLTGTIAATDSYAAAFRDGGQVIEVSHDVGDRVEAGEVLARVDPTRAQASEAAAQASQAAAEAALRQAEQARDRAASLLKAGTSTQAQLDAATESFVAARSSRDQAAAQLAIARRVLDDTVLRAVEAAIVTERSADPGEVVGAGQPVLTLASRTGREAVFLAPDLAGIDGLLGRPVQLSLLGGGQGFEAELTEISPVVAETGTVEVKAALADGQGAGLSINTPVEGRVTLPREPAIVLPWTALTATAAGPAVWTVNPTSMVVTLTPVTVAAYADKVIEISEGLSDDDLVVGEGSHSLYPGQVVRPMTEAP